MRVRRPARRVAVRAGAWSLTTIAAVWFATRYADSGAHPLAVPAALAPFAVVPAVVALALTLRVRDRLGFAAAGAVVVSCLAAQMPAYVASAAPGADPAQAFTVVTLNMKYGGADASAIVALAAARGADVVALEELTPDALPRLTAAGLTRDYPYSVLSPSTAANGVGLFSRTPLQQLAHTDVWPSGAVAAHVERRGGAPPVTVYAVHVPAPWPQSDGLWLAQLRAIPGIVADTQGAVVMAGDFNATTDHAPFRDMVAAAGFVDAADVAGAGWLRTYPSDSVIPPLLAIDHVLVRDGSATAVDTATIRGSDHRALIARLTVG